MAGLVEARWRRTGRLAALVGVGAGSVGNGLAAAAPANAVGVLPAAAGHTVTLWTGQDSAAAAPLAAPPLRVVVGTGAPRARTGAR